MISMRKAWTTPVLRVLNPNDELIDIAASKNSDFAAALRRHQEKNSEASSLVA